jgi:eukaryotic-like serine/threonine-protein kinase
LKGQQAVIGRKLSHYEILDDLGRGGMGVVYRARDTRLQREVAIKVLPTDRPLRPTAKARFQREALAASALNHPNIITIYEIGAEGETEFIVMEYVRGSNLSSLLKKRPLGVNETIHYSVQIADALAKAHGVGIIHRDLKPGNIMVTEDGLVKVLDFGLAKFNPLVAEAETDEEDRVTAPEFTLTLPGAVTGTPAYQSPEQARGEKVDTRSDIFALGTVMFEMFSRELPFEGTNTVAFLHNLHFSPPRNLAEVRPDLPKSLTSLVARMLEKKVDKRIQTAAEVSSELRRLSGMAESPLSWRPSDTTIEMVRLPSDSFLSRFSLRKRWMAVGLVLLIVIVAAGVWRIRHKNKAVAVAPVVPLFTPEESAHSLYEQARTTLEHVDQQADADNAIKLLERAVQLDPQSAANYAALSEAYYRKNGSNSDPQWVKLSAEYANKAVALDGYLAAGHISLGLVKMQAGDTTGAEKELLNAAELDPKSAIPHEWLGVLYDREGKLDKAAAELEGAGKLNGADWRRFMELGLNSYLVGNFKAAASNWEEALQLEPGNLGALENLGAAYHRLNRDDDAVAALQKVIVAAPTANVYNNLGSILFYQGKYDEAVPAFEKTVAMGANDYTNWGNLGDAYRWSSTQKDKAPGAYQTAIRMVREEIAKHPNQLDLRADLALYLAKSGSKDQALEALKPVEAANTKDPSILYNEAVVYELCGKRQKALDSLLAAVKAGQELNDIKNEPEFVSLRTDPQYQLTILSAASAKAPQP